tara:strand:- start:357 stop:515 length:159 start_codon:yes stop_codon:yes gene_type:complete
MWDLETIKILNAKRQQEWEEKHRQIKKLQRALQILDPEMYEKLRSKSGIFSK